MRIQWTMVRRLEDLDFVDDLVALLSHQIKDIGEKTIILSEIGKLIGLNTNIKKTIIMKGKKRWTNRNRGGRPGRGIAIHFLRVHY